MQFVYFLQISSKHRDSVTRSMLNRNANTAVGMNATEMRERSMNWILCGGLGLGISFP
jgi:hypothetical protein